MFRTNAPNNEAEKQVNQSVKNNVFAFFAMIAMIKVGKLSKLEKYNFHRY